MPTKLIGFLYLINLRMAEGKKSFLIYSDTINNIEHLTNEEKGILFQHLLEYVNDKNPVLEDRLILTAWKPIETHLKRDLKKWTDKSPGRINKAKKAGLASAKARQLKATKSNSLVENELKPTNSTVNVNVSVNDNIYIYSEIDFLKDWKTQRELILKKPTNIDKLAPYERTNFLLIKNQNTREEIINGMEGLFRQGNIKFETMTLRPKHFLDHFETYLSAYDEKNSSLYGRKKEVDRL